jgi:hypothetical protein
MRLADLRSARARALVAVALGCALSALLSGCDDSITGSNPPPTTVTAGGKGSPSGSSNGPSIFLSASPTSVSSGGAALLVWSVTNSSSCAAAGGWSGNKPASGNASTGSLGGTTTYTLSCTGAGGSASRSVTVHVNDVALNGPSCSASAGGLALRAAAARKTGVSPLLLFFDATGTTSTITGSGSAFQDISYRWDFGDTGSSGVGSGAHGANAGHNSNNSATGAVAAHLYVTNGADTTYTVTVTAYDGTNTASCQLHVTAYDPATANVFPGTQTTCVYNSAAGSTCPLARISHSRTDCSGR